MKALWSGGEPLEGEVEAMLYAVGQDHKVSHCCIYFSQSNTEACATDTLTVAQQLTRKGTGSW
jgi:hypothetical protein